MCVSAELELGCCAVWPTVFLTTTCLFPSHGDSMWEETEKLWDI